MMLKRIEMVIDYHDPEHLLAIGREVARDIYLHLAGEPIDDKPTFKKAMVAVMLEHPRIGPFLLVMGAAQVIEVLTTIVDANDFT